MNFMLSFVLASSSYETSCKTLISITLVSYTNRLLPVACNIAPVVAVVLRNLEVIIGKPS